MTSSSIRQSRRISLKFFTARGIAAVISLIVAACSGNPSEGSENAGGSAGQTSTKGSGGNATGGSSTGGSSTGGMSGTGGSTGGQATGGAGGAGGDDANDGGAGGTGGSQLPDRIVAGYYANWPESQIRLREVPENYNLIYLFAATPVGGSPGTTGAVEWTPPGNGRGAATHFKADLEYVRMTQGRKVLLSVGGQGAGMSFPNREKSQTFLDSVVGLYEEFGGFDGLDWNTFEADQAPDTEEMIWISLELKQMYPGFIISAPPAPWNDLDKSFCEAMVKAGAMDYAAPQYYDGPGLATQDYIVGSVDEWAGLVGADKLIIGFGIWDQTNYMAIEDAISTWNQASTNHPSLRGGFDWAIHIDESQGWPFANQLGPVINPSP